MSNFKSISENTILLAIESSCDDTSAAVLKGAKVLSNVVATQAVHEQFGGVVPELASREHQKSIFPVVTVALEQAGISKSEIDAIAYTRGPGLLGSLHVGAAFAKSLSIGLQRPLLEVHHMHAHILAHFIEDGNGFPQLPFLCLTVSGGHTQLVMVETPIKMSVIGHTLDDAAGEAFDKIAKIMGMPYPGGPLLDKLSKEGNPDAFVFPKSKLEGLNYSFSGLKTAVLYFLKKEMAKSSDFIEKNKADLAASVQYTIVSTLMEKLDQAVKQTGVKTIALAGGVSANSGLREAVINYANKQGVVAHIPALEYCTDNAAMIGMAGQFLYSEKVFGKVSNAPSARLPF
ncbi:MAG: N6-L-threonylcarbamoyladenine synthase [Flavobacteriales bacterium]|jgi:N6-L-threonylcarbamoyladenine synthase